MGFIPKMYENLNIEAARYNPKTIKPYNNESYIFWCHCLYERVAGKIDFINWPDIWNGCGIKDFLIFILLMQGYAGFTEVTGRGKVFGFCTIGSELNIFYQPTEAGFSFPHKTLKRKIGEDCEILKLTPDYTGIYDTVKYFAAKLALNDCSIDSSLINSKLAYLFGGKTKGAIHAIKWMVDALNRGEPAAFFDSRIQDDQVSKTDPFTITKIFDSKDFITDKLLETHQTILNEFDSEIGIKTIPYSKKERMVTSEADSKTADSQARIDLWIRTLNDSLVAINKRYGFNLKAVKHEPEETDPVLPEEGDQI